MVDNDAATPERSTRLARRPSNPADRANAILDAAVAVFARKGYQRARTREIAAEAGIAEGTIYNYFRGKRELLFALIQRLATETLPDILEQPVADERDLLTTIIRDRFAVMEKGGRVMQVIFQELAGDEELQQAYFREVVLPIMARVEPIITERINRGEMRPVNPRVLVPAVFGAVVVSALVSEMARRIKPPLLGPPLERETLIAGLVDFIMYGLAGPAGMDTDTTRGA